MTGLSAGLAHDGRQGHRAVQALPVCPAEGGTEPRRVLKEDQQRHHHRVPFQKRPHGRLHQLVEGILSQGWLLLQGNQSFEK